MSTFFSTISICKLHKPFLVLFIFFSMLSFASGQKNNIKASIATDLKCSFEYERVLNSSFSLIIGYRVNNTEYEAKRTNWYFKSSKGENNGGRYLFSVSNNKKLTSHSATKRTDCNDLKKRKLGLLVERKECEIIFCVILRYFITTFKAPKFNKSSFKFNQPIVSNKSNQNKSQSKITSSIHKLYVAPVVSYGNHEFEYRQGKFNRSPGGSFYPSQVNADLKVYGVGINLGYNIFWNHFNIDLGVNYTFNSVINHSGGLSYLDGEFQKFPSDLNGYSPEAYFGIGFRFKLHHSFE